MDFEWDEGKAALNIKKHQVAFEEAATVFADPLSMTVPDSDHSIEEDRLITMGTSNRGRVLIVSSTDREDRVRIVSARKATRHERKIYEKAAYPDL